MLDPEALPLTPAQEGILFESLARQGAYVQQLACTVSGTLEIDAFAAAWQRALARHPALRTTFAKRDGGEPIQLLHADAQLPITVLDWRDHGENAQAQMWSRLLADDRRAGFRLS